MKNWKIYVVLFVVSLALGGLKASDESVSADALMPPQTTLSVFSVSLNATDIPCEPTPSVVVAPNQIPLSINIKDFHNYIDFPLTENRKIEQGIHSYLYFVETLPASESLSRLHRLNI